MLSFVFRRIESRKWMVISLLIGNLLMIAIAAASPMYSRAILQRTLTRNLSDYYVEKNIYPGLIVLRGAYNTVLGKKKEEEFSKVLRAGRMMEELQAELGVPALYSVTQRYMNNVKALHELAVENRKNELTLRIASYSDQMDHLRIVNGEMYSGELDGHTFDVIVSEKTFVEQNLLLGEELELTRLTDASGNPYRIRIAGIFENSMPQDVYWVSWPTTWRDVCLMDETLFQELFANEERMSESFNMEWYMTLDYARMRGDQAERYLDVLDRYAEAFEDMGFNHSVYFTAVLEAFLLQAQKLNTTILILQTPVFILLAAFIFMVSRQILEMEQNEIAVYKSRGADRKQIVFIYLLQSLVISILGLAGGIPLGVLMCRLLGASNSFLEFVKRAALSVETGPKVWMFAGAAAFFSACTMVLPVIRYANVNIVAHKRGKNRKSRNPWWQKLFLDVILLGVSLYGLYQYYEQREYLMQKVLEGASLDPILYFCSSLFMVGAGLLVFRLFPLLMRILFMLGKRWWPPSLYVSFLRILRTRNNQGFFMVFLILTLAMGIFNAQAARTINANAEEKIRYSMGADVVLREVWKDNSALLYNGADDGGMAGQLELIYEEPDFGKYQMLDGVESVTKVLIDREVSVSVEGGRINNAMLMGIHTKEFGETAWFKDSLLPAHWYGYLNAISQNSRAILVSSNFQRLYGYEVGDVLNYTNGNGDGTRGIIYGFVDYWPSYAPVIRSMGRDGLYAEMDNFLIVAHLSQLQSSWGVIPYQIWIRTEGSSQFLYDYAEESGTKYALFLDTAAEIIKLKNDPIFQGTNGILTIGFICVLLLCITGFLIYWILSIQSRTLQFGIFRAMGMSMREVLTMLVNEQLFITGVSVAAGILVGMLTSRLFVPLIQIAYSSADQVIPLEIVSESGDYVRLFAVIGPAILICMFILGWLISKIKISQALKLGED